MYSSIYSKQYLNIQTYIKSYRKALKTVKGIQIDVRLLLPIANPQKWQMINKINSYGTVPALHNTTV